MVRPLLVLQVLVGVGILPLVFGLLFVEEAGAVGSPNLALEILLTLIGVLTAPIILVVALLASRRRVRTLPPSRTGETPVSEPLAVGGPIEERCSGCGGPFRISGVPLLAPHVGVGQTGSLYLRCPRCGERGWDPIVGRVST
ncbi:MAG: hypothetical protein L3K02_09110 [Thermoplasmata archaeon]|nr:hypothetical protein [Thermoplasmata archaeon]